MARMSDAEIVLREAGTALPDTLQQRLNSVERLSDIDRAGIIALARTTLDNLLGAAP